MGKHYFLLGGSMTRSVFYAITDDGLRLPIIDVTHPAFAVAATDAELANMADQYVFELESASRQEMPAHSQDALQHSRIGRGLISASGGTFMSGMNTYFMKLGPDNLGDGFEPIDGRMAASFPAFSMRLRLHDMARLLSDGLSATLVAYPQRPLCLINIAGGAGSDSWNALLQIHAEHANLLTGRKIMIAMFDIDTDGQVFCSRALDALMTPGAPLSDLDVSFRFFKYEWSAPEQLSRALDELCASDALCAISSEGGLFEYGSDTEVIANLQALHAGTRPETIVVGSFTRDGDLVRASHSKGRLSTQPRTIEAVRNITEQAGWSVQHVLERPFGYNVRLVRRIVGK
jgi:hypothetical protein